MPRVTALRQSGLYVFRNADARRMLVIDISPNKIGHGHYDCGSYHYFADGVRWLTDRGGPCKYASRMHRELMSSASHSVASPEDAGQMAGVAYNVDFRKIKGGWSLSFWTNVYGSKYRHMRRFVVGKDVSNFTVEDTFYGPDAANYVNRMVLGQGVNALIADAKGRDAVLKSGETSLRIRSSHRMHRHVSSASYKMNVLSPIKVLEADGLPDAKGEMRFSYTVESLSSPANATLTVVK